MPNDFDIAKRQLNDLTGARYIGKIELVNGSIRDANGYYYVRKLGTATSGADTVQNPIKAIRERLGVNKYLKQGRQVYVGLGFDFKEEIIGNVDADLEDAGIPGSQLNKANPSTIPKLLEHIINFNSYPNGDENVKFMGGIYRRPDGYFDILNAELETDLLTSYTPPTSGKQAIVCLWADLSTNTIVVTSSSEVDVTIDLRADVNNTQAITLINECVDSAPASNIGIWSYIVKNDTTTLGASSKLYDLRGIIGAGAIDKTLIGYPNPVVEETLIPAGRELINKGVITIQDGTTVTLKGVWWIE